MLLGVLLEVQRGCATLCRQIAVVNFKLNVHPFKFVEAVSSLLASVDVSYFNMWRKIRGNICSIIF